MTPHPTLILLPGMHGTADLFGPFLDVLPSHVPRKIVAYPTDRVMTYDQLVRLVEDQTHDVHGDLVPVAESFSGPVAVRFAAANPQRVRAVVLSGSYVRPPWPAWVRWFIRAPIFRLPIPDLLIRFLVIGSTVSDEYVDVIRQAIRQPTCTVLAARARETLSADSTPHLRRCRAPVLALQGHQDHLVLPSLGHRLRADHPGKVRLHKMNGPHLLLQASPMRTWRAIEAFLADLGPAQGSR